MHRIPLFFVLVLFWMAGCAQNSSGTAVCGDQKKNGLEMCDGADLGGAICRDLGFYGGTLACTAECVFDTSACTGRCGDGVVQASFGEACDGAELAGATCERLGYHGGTLACTSGCQLDESGCALFGRCGDGVIDTPAEECDEVLPENVTCSTLGHYGGTLACTTECAFDVSGCERCGDGILQSQRGEVCDGTELGSATCTDLGLPDGQLACRTCQYDTGKCAVVRQFGTAGDDDAADVAMTADHQVIVAGTVSGAVEGQTALGGTDGFIARMEPLHGVSQWTRLVGTPANDAIRSVAIDAAGNIFVAGNTAGAFPGFSSVGNDDAFLAKFNSLGELQWVRQWGTPLSDFATAVRLDGNGAILVAGYTYGGMDGNVNAGGVDVFLVKWNADGTKAWTRQWGTSENDYGYAIAIDAANAVYVTGNTAGAMHGNVHQGNFDAFLTKHDENGVFQWTRQLGTAGNDGANAAAVDAGGAILIAGYTVGDLWGQGSAGGYDAFVARFSTAGDTVWLRQGGTAANDYGNGIFLHQGNVYVVGRTDGPLDGSPQAGGGDAYVWKWAGDGSPQFARKWGSAAEDRLLAVTTDSTARVVAVGFTSGSMPGVSGAGMKDVLVIFTHGLL